MLPKPGVALQSVPFAEKPHIVKRGDNYYLRYRIAVDSGRMMLRMALVAKKTPGKGYYYLTAPISHSELGNVVERSLAYDGFTELARRNAVYWLNPNESEIHLEITEESDDTQQGR